MVVKYILSLDGGGVLGIATLYTLLEIDKMLKEKFGEGICVVFDLYSGTSVGGMISSALACGREPSELKDYLNNNIKKVFYRRGFSWPFTNRYSSSVKREFIAGILPSIKMNGNAVVRGDISTSDGPCHIIKPLVIPTYNATRRKAEVFKTTGRKAANTLLLDVIDATSAVPTYFPPVYLGTSKYVDGGVAACKDPCMCAYSEARSRWKDCKIKVLSIGTGTSEVLQKQPSSTWGPIQWILEANVVGMLIGGSGDLTRKNMRKLIKSDYLRINGKLDREIIMDSTDENDYEYLKEVGKCWFVEFEDKIESFFSDYNSAKLDF